MNGGVGIAKWPQQPERPRPVGRTTALERDLRAAVADLGPEATATPDVLPWSQLVQLVESHSDLPISEFCLAIARHLPNSADPQETNRQDRTLLAFRAEC